MCKQSLTFLRKALCRVKAHRSLFTLRFYGCLLGMFEMNNWGMKVRNPLELYYEHVIKLDAKKQKVVQQAFGKQWEVLKKCKDISSEGTGFYLLGACLNHSCMPNVQLSKPEGSTDDTTAVVSLRDITKNEQLFISYVDPKQSYPQRREALSFYGFECKCQKCLKDMLNLSLLTPEIVIYTSLTSGNRQVNLLLLFYYYYC